MNELTAGQFSLVYNAFSFTFATMAAATLFLWLGRSQVGPAYKTALTISGLVCAIAAYHYFRIFESWNAAYGVSDGVVTATNVARTIVRSILKVEFGMRSLLVGELCPARWGREG